MNISNQLKQADKLAAKAGRVICNALNSAYKCDSSDQHTYYVHNHKLYISYPGGFCAMDRLVEDTEVAEALRGVTPADSADTINSALVAAFGI